MYQSYLDRSVPHVLHRWLGTAGLVVVFLLRIVLAQGVSLHPLSLHRNPHQLVVSPVVYRMLYVGRAFPPPLLLRTDTSTLDAHAIYLLNLLLAFLQPKFDPSLEADIMADNIEEGGEELPTTRQENEYEEFRPFMRRLPEWDFWCVFVFLF